MKRILAVVAISTMFTGCAQLENNLRRNLMDSVDVAKEDCTKMGFSVGSPQYQNCVMVTTQNIRNVRAVRDATSQPNYGPEMTTCTGTGSIRTCNTTGGSSMMPRTTTCTGTGSTRTCFTN